MLILEKPELKDYWYEQKLESDPNTMSYNKGYLVSYDGYHYDTGCIDFPKEKWKEKYEKRKKQNEVFYYLKDTKTNEYVGYANYSYNKKENRYYCGIVIEYEKRGKGYAKQGLKLLCERAKENKIKALYDNFEKERNCFQLFKELGFYVVEETTYKKMGKEVKGVVVKKDL